MERFILDKKFPRRAKWIFRLEQRNKTVGLGASVEYNVALGYGRDFDKNVKEVWVEDTLEFGLYIVFLWWKIEVRRYKHELCQDPWTRENPD